LFAFCSTPTSSSEIYTPALHDALPIWDLSVYVDADEKQIEEWFYQRFNLLVDHAVDHPDDFYYQFTQVPHEKAMERAEHTWNNINLINLQEYILPTRNRANIVIHKEKDHYINKLWIKKY